MRARFARLVIPLALVACGDSRADHGTTDTSTGDAADAGAVFDAAASPDAADDGSGGGGVMMPPVSWPGACERVVLPMDGGDPLYTVTVDLSEAPGDVWLRRVDAAGNVAVFRQRDVDIEATCVRPPEEISEPQIDLIGCPAGMDTDLDGDGRQSAEDRDYSYQYGPGGVLVASDAFDAMDDTFLDVRWTWRWSSSGALLGAERDLSAGQRGRIDVYEVEGGFAFDVDRDGDGAVDERRTWALDDEGRVASGVRSTVDPGTGELVDRWRSEWRYDCPAADADVP